MPTVNQDYLCLINVENGVTCFEKVNIPQSEELVSALEQMAGNPNQTVMDMQSKMNLAFPPTSRGYINYVSPSPYYASYICGTSYPTSRTQDEYNAEMERKSQEYGEEFESMYADMKSENPGLFLQRQAAYLDVQMEEYAESVKKSYLSSAKRYIMAHNYTATLNAAKSRPGVRMYSTDTLGWSDFTYKVTDDVTITIGTNFGYGQSSYFHLGLRYKGIDVLPYSFVTKYYFANMADIIRYTQLYEVEHDSWNVAFEFVERMANLAAATPEAFIKETIVNEVKEMLDGLRAILESPRQFMDAFAGHAGETARCSYVTVRNMYSSERSTYEAYPHEMSMAVKAEKITGALDFLDNLRKLSEQVPGIGDAAAQICEMASSIVPEIESMMRKLGDELALLDTHLEAKRTELEGMNAEMKPHDDAIERLYEEAMEKNGGASRYFIREAYAKQHEDYLVLRNQFQALESEICTLENERRQRASFRTRLGKCVDKVEGAKLKEAA
jgi:hypothetical protein